MQVNKFLRTINYYKSVKVIYEKITYKNVVSINENL
jgi:hypothetical protein